MLFYPRAGADRNTFQEQDGDVSNDDPRPFFSSLSSEAKHILARKALVHQTDAVQVNVYVLEPGGRIPAHRHSTSWDISCVIEGEIEARFGDGRTARCGPQAINVVPPGTVHEIANASATQPAKLLLIQSPSQDFDFIKSELPLPP